MAVDDWFGTRSYRTFTVTIASPGIFTSEAHGLSKNDKVTLLTTGALPTGLSVNTYYYAILITNSDGSVDEDTFKLSATFDGSAITTTGTQSGAHSYAKAKKQRMYPTQESNR